MKLALIGKNISHSLSPEVYKKLLGDKLTHYDLLDYQEVVEIPQAADLLSKWDGISITSPYKKHFLSQSSLVGCPLSIAGINCLRMRNGLVEATNTDYLALKILLKEYENEFNKKKIIILGDGVMSKITEIILQKLGLVYEIYSRKLTSNFSDLVFQNCFIINACSREFEFNSKVLENVIFWDFNYNLIAHQTTLPFICEKYISGYSLLETQAKCAIEFWNEPNHL